MPVLAVYVTSIYVIPDTLVAYDWLLLVCPWLQIKRLHVYAKALWHSTARDAILDPSRRSLPYPTQALTPTCFYLEVG